MTQLEIALTSFAVVLFGLQDLNAWTNIKS